MLHTLLWSAVAVTATLRADGSGPDQLATRLAPPCPSFRGAGCLACVAHIDGRCPGRWCNSPCVHTSRAVGAGTPSDCMPASWWDASHPAGVTCVGNATGCAHTCTPTPSPPPSPNPPKPPPSPPQPPGPAPPPPGPSPPALCVSDLNCSLNGVCGADGRCDCDEPWTGPRCGVLAFAAASPAAGRDLYNVSDTDHNTWNGPIVVESAQGMSPLAAPTYHMYLPLYPKGDLYHPVGVLHGTAGAMEGPWTWVNLTTVPPGLNPGALVFNDTATGHHVYTLWLVGVIYVADNPAGPFSVLPYKGQGPVDCSINASPLLHNGVFYCMGHKGQTIWTSPALAGPWRLFAEVGAAKQGGGEDPFLWVDTRGHWHVLYHSAGGDLTGCGNSTVSQHIFSANGGRNWSSLVPRVEPYKPVVHWADGVHVYATMERPHGYFDASGRMTHLGVAAPLNIGDEGCAKTPHCFPARQQGHCPCVNCKYSDHAGSLLISLA